MTFFDTPPPVTAAEPVHRRRRGWLWPLGIVAAIAIAVAAVGGLLQFAGCCGSTAGSAAGSASANSSSASSDRESSATFTRLDGSTRSIDDLRGQRTVLWLVAAGCSSCGVSIPVVAAHLNTLAAEGWHVVALDLYGDLPTGPEGLRDLKDFVHATGGNPDDPRWTWGLSSQPLSMTYDATGAPDQYYLLDEQGQLRYQGSVPVSTMPQLLDHAKTLAAAGS